jgi:signal transduction histidine kinase
MTIIGRNNKRSILLYGWLVLFLTQAGLGYGATPGATATSAAPVENVLTNASDILALSAADAAKALPIRVRGVVTGVEVNWAGRFFIQDASGGVFADNVNHPAPALGDWVEVTGFSHPGGYAPVITRPHWKKMGTAPLPAAKPVTIERLMSGTEDSQRVEISGIVRTAQTNADQTMGIEVVSGGYRLRAYFPLPANPDPQALIGDKVLMKGTVAAAFNAPLRHFITVTLFVPRLEDFVVEQSPRANPFDQPLTPLNAIAQYRKDSSLEDRVHVKGVVTYQRNGADLFIQDNSGGLQIRTAQTNSLIPGDVVEAVGFSAVDNFLPVLEDASFRKVNTPPTRPVAKPATIGGLLAGWHHADLISLRGRLIDRLTKGIGQANDDLSIRTTLVLQSSNFLFTAERDTAEPNSLLAAIPIGSLVEADGICLLDSGDDGKIKSLRLLLPTSHDIRIIQKPSWLTPKHLLASLAAVVLVLIVAVSWTVMVSKRNSILKSLVREKESAKVELQTAHDQLEERVKERTAQLKVEMTARKESQLQFRAVLTERTRLAQELHDTLEQTMTGIALQLDMVATQFEKKPDHASHHLKLARNLMKQSQVDLRQSVWGLRSRADEQFNLTSALVTSGRQITGDAGLQIEVQTIGDAGPLSEIAEENLLRIGQEAITNAVKHSGAAAVKIKLTFDPQKVVLEIRDNGKGFDPESCVGPRDGHFGLLGIRERTERLGGQVRIASAPGAGACLSVEIPTNPRRQPPTPTETHEEIA